MTRISTLICAAVLLFGSVPAMAAEGDVRTCALTRAVECSPVEGCKDRSIRDMDLPRFVRIDLLSKTISSLDKDVARSSMIGSVERQSGHVVMHGTEHRGWTIVLGEDAGSLTLAAAGEEEGFVVFGSCLQQ